MFFILDAYPVCFATQTKHPCKQRRCIYSAVLGKRNSPNGSDTHLHPLFPPLQLFTEVSGWLAVDPVAFKIDLIKSMQWKMLRNPYGNWGI